MKLLLSAMLCVLAVLFALGWRSGEGLRLVEVSPRADRPVSGSDNAMAAMASPHAAAAAEAPSDAPEQAPASARLSTTAAAAAASAPAPAALAPPTMPASLLLPVQGVGVDQLHDTFTDARGEGRVHDAIDIMAAAGTPVLAVADGKVEKLFDSARGGLTLYQFEPTGRLAYYYAHLQRYADGLAEGQDVRRGQVIGYVGSTGNASADAPHLHFAIFVLGPERHWWEGAAVNPYPILRGEQPLP